MRPLFDEFVSTTVEAFCRAVLLEFHKPREERYLLTSSNLRDFILDYLYRLLVILDPAKRKEEKGRYLVSQLGIEHRGLHHIWGDYKPAYEGRSFWCHEVTAKTHHQLNLCYWENIILYLLALNFLEFEHLEARLRYTLVRSTKKRWWRANNGSGHEVVQNPQRITRSQSCPSIISLEKYD